MVAGAEAEKLDITKEKAPEETVTKIDARDVGGDGLLANMICIVCDRNIYSAASTNLFHSCSMPAGDNG